MIALFFASSALKLRWVWIVSINCSPIVNIGFNEVWGSWKIKPIFLPLYLTIFSGSAWISIPSKTIEPFETLPGSSIRFIIALPTVLFPDPDSPTNPRISPLLTSIFTIFSQHRPFLFSFHNQRLNYLF